MNWLVNVMRPKIKSGKEEKEVKQKDVPDHLWVQCPACNKMIFHTELEQNLKVCPSCGHPMRLTGKERLDMMFDDKKYKEIKISAVKEDPLNFSDLKKYPDRLKEYRKKTGLEDAIVMGHGTIGGNKAVVAAFDFRFGGGSMGTAVGESLIKAFDVAKEEGAAFIAVPASGGARMQEGMLSLMQMARTTAATNLFKQTKKPYIVVFTDPTAGGVTASFGMLGDIHLAEPKATIAFAGARVIEQTTREKLPANFQKSEYLYDHGMVDKIVPRKELKEEIGTILSLLMNKEEKEPAKPKK